MTREKIYNTFLNLRQPSEHYKPLSCKRIQKAAKTSNHCAKINPETPFPQKPHVQNEWVCTERST